MDPGFRIQLAVTGNSALYLKGTVFYLEVIAIISEPSIYCHLEGTGVTNPKHKTPILLTHFAPRISHNAFRITHFASRTSHFAKSAYATTTSSSLKSTKSSCFSTSGFSSRKLASLKITSCSIVRCRGRAP